jgi:hypothetical protein
MTYQNNEGLNDCGEPKQHKISLPPGEIVLIDMETKNRRKESNALR